MMFSYTFAEDNGSVDHHYGDIQSYDFDFSVEANGASVKAKWNAFPKDRNMKWYKLAFSQTDDDPTYPESDARFLGWKASKTSETVVFPEIGTYYLRLCAITHDDERYCSEVEKVELTGRTHHVTKKNPVKKVKTIQHSVEVKKEESSVEETPTETQDTVKKRPLSTTTVNRIETSVAKFVDRLEGKWYSDAEMINILKNVIARLENLATQDKYHKIANYMIEILEGYKSQYQDEFDALESILNEF